MKVLRKIIVVLFLALCCPEFSFGQDTAVYKLQENFKREIIIRDKRFRVYNNWFSGGGGIAGHTANPYMQVVLAVNINFHIKRQYFRLGGMMSGQDFGLWNNYQLHGGWIPYRKETEKYNLAFIGGIAYSTGYKFVAAPDKYDNKGELQGVSPELRQQKIDGRIKSLEKQIKKNEGELNKANKQLDQKKEELQNVNQEVKKLQAS